MDNRVIFKTALQAGLAFAAVGAVTYFITRDRQPARRSVDCSDTGGSKGTLGDVRYFETMRGGASPDEAVPMIVSFHSLGANGKGTASFPGLGTKARVIRPEGAFKLGQGFSWVEQKTTDPKWAAGLADAAARMARFIEDIMRCRPTVGKPVVTGSSQGGHMTYAMTNMYPGLVKGGVAVLGYLPPELWNRNMAPTVGINTTGDNVVPYQRTKQFWDAMQSAGAPLETMTFPGGHSVGGDVGAAWRSKVKAFV